MRRRKFFGVVGGTLAAPLLWLSARAQQRSRVPRVGVLWHAGNAEQEGEYFTALVEGFRALGYVDGKSVIFEHRFANEQYDRFQTLAAELVGLNVDVLVTITGLAASAAHATTRSVPVVFNLVPDPVASKFAESFARPGGNMTGLATLTLDITGKRMELLKEALPGLKSVAVLSNPKDQLSYRRNVENLQKETVALNLSMQLFEVQTPEDIDKAFPRIVQAGVQAVFVGNDPMLFNERRRIADLALAQRLPVQPSSRLGVLAGGFMSYGPQSIPTFHRLAYFADRILKGEKPGNLPIEQVDKLELLFNIKTAKALGITIPHQLIARADELIE